VCYQLLLSNGKSEEAGRVMIELLGTYTTENASQAREEAQRCIIASLAGTDPPVVLSVQIRTQTNPPFVLGMVSRSGPRQTLHSVGYPDPEATLKLL
jgi:hypothetical protein